MCLYGYLLNPEYIKEWFLRGYRITQENAKWYFELIPPNNNKQPIGRSSLCATREECVDKLNTLRKLIIENRISNENYPYISISEQSGRFVFYYICDEVKIYESRVYWKKSGCIKSISAICKHVDEYTLHENTN